MAFSCVAGRVKQDLLNGLIARIQQHEDQLRGSRASHNCQNPEPPRYKGFPAQDELVGVAAPRRLSFFRLGNRSRRWRVAGEGRDPRWRHRRRRGLQLILPRLVDTLEGTYLLRRGVRWNASLGKKIAGVSSSRGPTGAVDERPKARLRVSWAYGSTCCATGAGVEREEAQARRTCGKVVDGDMERLRLENAR